MAKPTVRDFRSPRICQRVFANTSEAIILEAINAAYDDYRIRRNLRSYGPRGSPPHREG